VIQGIHDLQDLCMAVGDTDCLFDSLARSRTYSLIGPWESVKARFNSAHGVPMGVYV